MPTNDRLERVKKLVHMQGGHSAPSASRFMPEIRSDHKWPLNVGRPAASFRQLLIVWHYSVSFPELPEFHAFLKTNEPLINSSCLKRMKGVEYRGTYLNMESGSPMYQTIWAYNSVDVAGAFKLWDKVLKDKKAKNFHKAMVTLRSYWARDPGRSEHRYRLASLYSNLDALAKADTFLKLTLEGVSKRRN